MLVIGAAGLVVFGYPSLGFQVSLPQVDPSRLGHGITYHGAGLNSQWTVLVLITSLTMVAATGLPAGAVWRGRGSFRGAVAQGIGGVMVGGWTALISQFTLYFSGPGDGCYYSPSCWPLNEQAAAFVVPGVLTGVVMALLVNQLSWSVRAFTPVAVWVATLIQYWVWTTYLLPVFEGPPR